VIPEQGQARDGLREMLDLLEMHDIAVYYTTTPYPAFVVPLEQAESKIARHLLLGDRSKLNELPPAFGVDVVHSESLSATDRRAFMEAELGPAVLLPPPRVLSDQTVFVAEPTVRATALVNRLLATGSVSAFRSGAAYLLEGSSKTIGWYASRMGVSLESTAGEVPSDRQPLALPRVAVYAGQGIVESEWGEMIWALDEGAFPYRLLDDHSITVAGALDDIDVLMVPHGSADEIVHGWDPKATGRASPWEPAEPQHGIGSEGLEAVRSFVDQGGTYVGIGGGGALLAGKDYLGLTSVEMIPSSVGLGQVRLRPAGRGAPILFGYSTERPIPAFFYAPPGSTERGYVFRAAGTSVAFFDGVHEYEDERSFVSTEVLSAESGNGAIVHEKRGQGHVALFGIAPTFRGQWRSNFRLIYNALYLSTMSK
jgi:hypothetical protein